MTKKEGFALVNWGREDRGGEKHRETAFGLSPGGLYPPREMPTASSGAWE